VRENHALSEEPGGEERTNRGGIEAAHWERPTDREAMKNLLLSNHKDGGFTFIDLLIVLGTVAMLVTLGLVWNNRFGTRCSASRINCVSNLKQAGLGFRIWSNDHEDKFPWLLSTNAGGTLEYTQPNEVFRHFEIASNELNSPKILVCPRDTNRVRAHAFGTIPKGLSNYVIGFGGNTNLSYFAGLTADENLPGTILSGDRTITTNGQIMSGVATITDRRSLAWAKGIHPDSGNIGLADGSVALLSSRELRDNRIATNVLQRNLSFALPARLAIP
jgi:prepilin-type processing-associated H-X9-DG protein